MKILKLNALLLKAAIVFFGVINVNTGVVKADTLAKCSEYINYKAYPKFETRAVWLTTIGGLDWPHNYSQSQRSAEKQKRELINILDKLAEANINTVLLQTRIRATTIYPSTIEPWDGCLSGFPGRFPGYDALQFAIDECHKRGMEIHAWIVVMPIGSWNGLGCKLLRKSHPRMIKKIGNEGYMDPESSETAGYIGNICKEIAKNYDIDGIHLDYIRYPETCNIKIKLSQARENITRIVRTVSHEVKGLKPWIKMSCSPIGKFDDLARYWSHGWNAYSRTCQDAQGWIADGLMDMLFPMMYFRDDQFFPFALDWMEQSRGKDVVAGLGIYMLSPIERDWNLEIFKRQMDFVRSINMGQAFFRCKFLTDNVKGIYDYVRDIAFPYPALNPPLKVDNAENINGRRKEPMMPQNLKVERVGLGYNLSWQGDGTLYNIYASSDSMVDTSNARNLVAIRYRGTHIRINGLWNKSFAVTSIDRYGNESEAAFCMLKRISDS